MGAYIFDWDDEWCPCDAVRDEMQLGEPRTIVS